MQDSTERMGLERNELLELEVRLHTPRLHPNIGVGASDKARLGRETVWVVFGLDFGWKIGRGRIRDQVVDRADVQRRRRAKTWRRVNHAALTTFQSL